MPQLSENIGWHKCKNLIIVRIGWHFSSNKYAYRDVYSALKSTEIVEQISTPLAKLFNLSLEEGIVPSEWKEANITPLFKKVSRNIN